MDYEKQVEAVVDYLEGWTEVFGLGPADIDPDEFELAEPETDDPEEEAEQRRRNFRRYLADHARDILSSAGIEEES